MEERLDLTFHLAQIIGKVARDWLGCQKFCFRLGENIEKEAFALLENFQPN